jgi:tetratricopeptide (TPR) repeat protein
MHTYSIEEIRHCFANATDFNEIFDVFQSALAQKVADLEPYRLLFWNPALSSDEIQLFGQKLATEFPEIAYDVFLWLAAVFKVTTSQRDNFELAIRYYRQAARRKPSEGEPYLGACDCHDPDLNIPPRALLIEFLEEGLPHVADPIPVLRNCARLLELDGRPDAAEECRRKIDEASSESRE